MEVKQTMGVSVSDLIRAKDLFFIQIIPSTAYENYNHPIRPIQNRGMNMGEAC